ncbi:MAG: thioredoxin domain-containing protein [Verrucomicrobiota bacterium]|nr:thioredoxin domain-containing protein [Verrucomicrobiota bacterium]
MNRLAHEKSLYLHQHAENPVDWFPWGPEALEKATAEDKPLLVSIGYSACHWCHVMAHESFESEYIAGLMNRHFVCIKVDREERPDVDQIYMEAIMMMNGHGGWPLNVFCLPDGRPFAGGTYFPPEDRGNGMIPWPQLVMRVAEFYKKNRDQLEQNATAIVGNIAASNHPPGATGESLPPPLLIEGAKQLCASHDDEFGGFGSAPKFPPAMTLNFLLSIRSSRAAEADGLARRIDQVVRTTLNGMACGGLFDQVGGGFSRYSVDRYWCIPHFEKMLYDNALLLSAYARGWRRYANPLYRSVIEETIAWLTRDMLAPNGGFYAALDADSEGEEGKYYVWTPTEIHAVLGETDGARFCHAYGISMEGNFEHGASNPTLLELDPQLRAELKPLRDKLLQVRHQRIPPGKDTKQLTAWNALLIGGLAEAAWSLGRHDWFTLASDAAAFLWNSARRGDDRLNAVVYCDGPRHNGCLDDYAFLAEAYLTLASYADWHTPGSSTEYIHRAQLLVESILRHFGDISGAPGCFFTSNDHETLAARKKDWWDNATPSGNSSLLHALSCLHALTGETPYRELFDSLRFAYPDIAQKAPAAAPHALAAFADEALGLCVIKTSDAAAIEPLRVALCMRPWRRTFVVLDPQGTTGYQLCVGTQCLPPERDPTKVAAMV